VFFPLSAKRGGRLQARPPRKAAYHDDSPTGIDAMNKPGFYESGF
jgi:hypothetical protein